MILLNIIAIIITVMLCIISLLPNLSNLINNSKISMMLVLISKKIENKYYKSLIAIIMFAGIGVRLWKFGIIPAGFNQDGAMGAVDALALANHGTDRFGMWLPVHFTAWGFGQMSVLLSYLSTPFIALFGLSRFTARIPVVLVSILALWTIYSLSKLIFNKRVAVLVLFFCAINPWQIMQSRWAIDCNMLPHFFLFSVYFLCVSFIKGKKRYLYISMVFFGLTMYTYGIAWYTVPLFLVITSIFLLINKNITFKEVILPTLIYLFIGWPIFAVMIVNFFNLPTINTPFFTIPYFYGTSRKADILFFSKDFLIQLKINFQAVINVVIIQNRDLPWNAIPEYGTIYLFSLPILLFGFVELIRNLLKKSFKNKIQCIFLFIWLCLSLLSGLIINSVNVNRINIVFYPLIILCGYGIYSLVSRVKIFSVTIVLLYLVAFLGFNLSYFGEHSNIIGEEFYEGFAQAMDYVEDLDYDIIYITDWTQSENSPWVSESLALFHHKIDALYFQGKAVMYSSSGKKLLPYKDRYKYVQIKQLNINPEENAVYIVRNVEIEKLDYKMFKIINFKHFNAVIPKKFFSSYLSLGNSKDVNYQEINKKEELKPIKDKKNDISFMYIYFVLFFIISFIIYYLIRESKFKTLYYSERFYLIIILTISIVIKIFLAVMIEGFYFDIKCFMEWSNLASKSISNFYTSGIFCDYPPFYILVLFLIGKLADILNIIQNSGAHILLIKLPSIISDTVVAYILYKISMKYFNNRFSLFIFAIYIFNPAVLLNSTLWGQVDSFFTMLIIIALLFIKSEKFGCSSAFFAAAILMKPQGIIFLPILFFELLKRKNIYIIIQSFIYAMITSIFIIMPFSFNKSPLWIIGLYKNTLGQYSYASMNAFNFFALFGGNFKEDSFKLLFFSYRTWGFIFIIFITLFTGFLYLKSKNTHITIVTAIVLITGVFVLASRMHERYLYPAICMSLLAFLYCRDIRMLRIFFGITFSSFANAYRVLARLFNLNNPHIPPNDNILLIISLINVLIFIYLVKVSIDIVIKNKISNGKNNDYLQGE